MSERENGREKSNSSGRGVGLAAVVIAAVGVGVGAALYYFLNKRTENNPEAGISSQNWLREDTQFNFKQMASEDSYTTVSENSTTDTSILSVESEDTDNEINLSIDGSDEPAISVSSYDSSDEDTTHETGYITSNQRNSSMSDMSVDWDTTNSSIEAPDNTREYIIAHLSNLDRFYSTPNIIARNTRLQTARRQEQETRRMQAL